MRPGDRAKLLIGLAMMMVVGPAVGILMLIAAPLTAVSVLVCIVLIACGPACFLAYRTLKQRWKKYER